MIAALALYAALGLGAAPLAALGWVARRKLAETGRPASASPHMSTLPAVVEVTGP